MTASQLSELRIDCGDTPTPLGIVAAILNAPPGDAPWLAQAVDLHHACLKRLVRPRNGWCLQPQDHVGDCAGLSSAELGVTDFGPRAAVSTRRSKP
jgi:hypothetical protein